MSGTCAHHPLDSKAKRTGSARHCASPGCCSIWPRKAFAFHYLKTLEFQENLVGKLWLSGFSRNLDSASPVSNVHPSRGLHLPELQPVLHPLVPWGYHTCPFWASLPIPPCCKRLQLPLIPRDRRTWDTPGHESGGSTGCIASSSLALETPENCYIPMTGMHVPCRDMGTPARPVLEQRSGVPSRIL